MHKKTDHIGKRLAVKYIYMYIYVYVYIYKYIYIYIYLCICMNIHKHTPKHTFPKKKNYVPSARNFLIGAMCNKLCSPHVAIKLYFLD